MSLPDAPNTLREKYYSVMAGQNDASILPDIETAPSTENRYLDYIARNGGGGGGDVTKDYVDEQDAKKTDKVTSAISGNFAGLDANGNLTDSGKKATDFATASDMSDVQGVIPSTATTQNKLATAADVTGEEISSTSTTSPLTDSADGMVQGVTIYGRSEVVDGEIKSVGDNGLTVTTANSDNTLTTSAEFTTALPLHGVSEIVRDVMEWGGSAGMVTKNCAKIRLADLTWRWWNEHPNIIYAEVVDKQVGLCDMMCSAYPYRQDISFSFSIESAYPDKTIYCAINISSIFIKNTDYNTKEDFVASLGDAELVYELAAPVTTPLTTAEISAFRGLKTYDSTTNITITDSPDFELDYLKNTNNGKAVADIQKDLQGQIDDKITISPQLTLTVAGWDSTTLQQTVTFVHDTTKRNVIDVDPASVEEWAACGIIARYETASNITFTCKSIPENALSFKVTSMGV